MLAYPIAVFLTGRVFSIYFGKMEIAFPAISRVRSDEEKRK